MKKSIIIPILIALFFATGFIGQSETNYNHGFDSINNPTDIVLKGIMVNGEVLPLINLPVVEITGDIENRTDLVKAVVINGEIVPMIELEEVVITPNV